MILYIYIYISALDCEEKRRIISYLILFICMVFKKILNVLLLFLKTNETISFIFMVFFFKEKISAFSFYYYLFFKNYFPFYFIFKNWKQRIIIKQYYKFKKIIFYL